MGFNEHQQYGVDCAMQVMPLQYDAHEAVRGIAERLFAYCDSPGYEQAVQAGQSFLVGASLYRQFGDGPPESILEALSSFEPGMFDTDCALLGWSRQRQMTEPQTTIH
jgi:hypothetical protein